MLRLLDRQVLGELLRLTVLTTAVLVTVTAFGAAIKPIAHDNLLSVPQTLKYIVLVIVPMLQFALPFAAGFAATMSLHRMTADNEVVAAATSGISYLRLLAPIIGLGLALTVVMILLTQWIVPRFWGFLENAVTADITRVFQAAIERGEPFEFGDRQIYADKIVVQTDPGGSEADTRLILFGVAAAAMSEEGRIDKDVTAQRAIVDVYRRPGTTFVKLAMFDAVAYDPNTGVLAQVERLDSRTIKIPSTLRDDARHKTQRELYAMRRDPDLSGSVTYRKRNLAEGMRDEVIWTQIDEHIAATRSVEFAVARDGGPHYVVWSDRLEGGRFRVEDGEVEIVRLDDGRPVRRFYGKNARLERRVTGPGEPVRFDLAIADCTVTSVDAPGVSNRRQEVLLVNLALTEITAADLVELPSPALLELVAAQGEDATPVILALADELSAKIDETRDEVNGRLQKRYALSMTALLLITLGALLAMWLRGAMPLTIYLLAFLPSLADLVLISSGEQMMREGVVLGGRIVLWSGNVFLVALIVMAYVRLRRH